MTGAIFLDRDGTINQMAPPHQHITRIMDFRFIPFALSALAKLAQKSERKIVIVTNQSCVGRGTMAWDDLTRLHSFVNRGIKECGGRVDGLYVCPHVPWDGCGCRKPQPGLLFQAAQELHIDLKKSVIVGDSHTDLIAGIAAGVPEGYLICGTEQGILEVTGDFHYTVCSNLFRAAELIVEREHNERF